jgi:ADP-ribose pyrophosphatase YjhB (NUDIX family)
VPAETIHAWSKEEFGYASPKVDVRAFILDHDRVLLIREYADARRWPLPGGRADVNESPSESVIREVEEESGYVVNPTRLLAVFDREEQGHTPPFPYHVYKLFFHCETPHRQSFAESNTSACSEAPDVTGEKPSRHCYYQGRKEVSSETDAR